MNLREMIARRRRLSAGAVLAMLLAIGGLFGTAHVRAQVPGTIGELLAPYQSTGLRVFTSTNLLALHTTPIVFIPAPGVGKAIVVLQVHGGIIYNANTYADTGATSLYYGSSAGLKIGGTALHTMLVLTATNITDFSITAITGAPSQYVNEPVMLTGTADMTAGDSKVNLTVIYTVIDVPAT